MQVIEIPSRVSKVQAIEILRILNVTCDYDGKAIFYKRHTILVDEEDAEYAQRVLDSLPGDNRKHKFDS